MNDGTKVIRAGCDTVATAAACHRSRLVTDSATRHGNRQHATLLLLYGLLLLTSNYPIHLVIKTCYDITHCVLLTSLFDSERLFTEKGNHHHLQFIDNVIIIRSVMLYWLIGGTVLSFTVIQSVTSRLLWACMFGELRGGGVRTFSRLHSIFFTFLSEILSTLRSCLFRLRFRASLSYLDCLIQGVSSHFFQCWNSTHFQKEFRKHS